MKKILAVLSVLGVATMLSGCSANMETNNFAQNIKDFKQSVNEYAVANDVETTQIKVGKYMLSTSMPEIDEIKTEKPNSIIEKQVEENQVTSEKNSIQPLNELNEPILKVDEIKTDTDNEQANENDAETKTEVTNEQISTLFSLSSDIDDCCENFVTLKQNLTDAITETQNLINKVNNKEIELNNEQKLMIVEQSKQLKELGRKLASINTELAISLSDLNDLMLKNGDLNNLSLKYLIVLDNLINGNEMLENGLYSLNLINNMFNTARPLPPNNIGRILYGYRRNNEQPVVKDYLIDKEGKIVENTNQDGNEQANNENENTEKTTNIDTMQNTNLNTNIDTYRNYNRNVDSFFNTALLDNEFMYGNGAGMLGNGLMYGYGNMNGYNQYNMPNEQYNTTNRSVLSEQNTQDNEVPQIDNSKTQSTKKQRKWFNISKNVDTYKNADTPKLSTRLNKIKNSFSGFFNKFSKKN